MSQATAPSTAASTLDVKNKELERQLESVTAHRDELSADVEALCNASSGNIFGASNALKSRIAERQREANKLRRQVHPLWTMTRPGSFFWQPYGVMRGFQDLESSMAV